MAQANDFIPNPLYMSDTATGETVQVDAPEPGVPAGSLQSQFQLASVTGSKVFFLDGEPLTKTSKLTPPLQGFDPGPPTCTYTTRKRRP